MSACMFASDLHGRRDHYRKLFGAIARERPGGVFLGGDLLPPALASAASFGFQAADFINAFVLPELTDLKDKLNAGYPRIFVILGNDDERFHEASVLAAATQDFWEYVNLRRVAFGPYPVYGYAFVPPTPFALKDWERYDVSRYVDPGCVSPEKGRRSVPLAAREQRYASIQKDLEQLVGGESLDKAIMLCHSPPYDTRLDRAALDGKQIDHVPLDVHVGSIALRRLIETRQPLLTLHGHVHESARLSGAWQDVIGRTRIFTAAHDGPELALVRFDPDNPSAATRELL